MIATYPKSAMAKTTASTTHKDCKYIADQLVLTADLLELLTGNPTESDLYRQGATMLRQSPDFLHGTPTIDLLDGINGLATDVLLDAQSLLLTGDTELLLRLRERIPASVRAMLPLHGLGPKRLRVVWKEMGILDIASLTLAVTENRLLRQKGFGPKTQEKVKESLTAARLCGKQFALSDLRPITTILEHELRELLGADARFDFTGAYRRGCSICDGVELMADPDHYKAIMLHIIRNDRYEIMTAGQDMIWARVRDTEVPLVFHFKGLNYYLELFRTTGSAAHVAAIPVDENKHYKSEAEIYADAGLPYIPAALREGLDEIALVKKKGLPKLVHHTDIQGLLHAHSTYSDGSESLESMALHCQAMGMHYLGISDHGPHHPDGQGMTLEEIKQQHKEIDRLNLRLAPFRILKGIELDILEDGSLGLRELDLASFDFVIASLHETAALTIAETTIRLVRAIQNPYTTILGHATGRLLFGSAGHAANMETVIDACAQCDVAIELNCNPQRIDLDWKWIRVAVAQGVRVAINPDAHSAAALHDVENGISEARKGLLSPARTLNALPLAEIEDHFLARRSLRIR
jgi:DNA polymerase (family X)